MVINLWNACKWPCNIHMVICRSQYLPTDSADEAQNAGRAIQLSEDVLHDKPEPAFLEKLAGAKSNVPEHADGSRIYNKFVKPAMLDLKKVGIHYAVSSLFEDYPEKSRIYSYTVTQEDYQKIEAGTKSIAIGKIALMSEITRQAECLSFAVLHLAAQDRDCDYRIRRQPIQSPPAPNTCK